MKRSTPALACGARITTQTPRARVMIISQRQGRARGSACELAYFYFGLFQVRGMIHWVVSTSRDMDEIPHLIKKLTDGNEVPDTVFPAHGWAWSKVAGLCTGLRGEEDAAAGRGCSPLSPSPGLQ